MTQILGPNGKPITSAPTEKRNYAFSSGVYSQMPTAEFSTWTVDRAVKDGMRASTWVYRAISIIRNAATDAPFVVADRDTGEYLPGHPITKILDRPNAQMSRKRTFSLLIAWLQLAGVAYLIKTMEGGRLQLWPTSPDRLAPIPSSTQDQIVTGYGARTLGGGVKAKAFNPEDVIAILLDDPSNPVRGIGPLQAAAKVVDADLAQVQWNYSAMKNRGVLDGFVSFDQELDQDQITAIEEKLRDKYAGADNARRMGVFGSSAKYTRIGLNAAEMDFIESRKAGRDEQLAAFGVSSLLVNANDSATYNNLRTAGRMLWEQTIIPLLGTIADALTFDFQTTGVSTSALADDEIIVADYSRVQALQQDLAERSDAADKLYRIGVPTSQINRILNLGLEEFPNWDKSFSGRAGPDAVVVGSQPMPQRARFKLAEFRALKGEFVSREKAAQAAAKKIYQPLLNAQHSQINAILETNSMDAAKKKIKPAMREHSPDWVAAITNTYLDTGSAEGASVVVESRAAKSRIRDAIEEALATEAYILREVSEIQDYTVDRVIEQIDSAIESGASIGDLQQAIEDVGAFSSDRALRIARTVSGSAANLGQTIAAIEGGATSKTWETSGFGTRSLHEERNGETVGVEEEFTRVVSSNGVYPQFPLDPRLAPEDRINCRCVLSFSV